MRLNGVLNELFLKCFITIFFFFFFSQLLHSVLEKR